MALILAHKIALHPNKKQRTYLAKAVGCARFAYNWALDEWKAQYKAWKADNTLPKPSEAALRRQLNSIKREEFPWMLEVTKCAPQMAIKHLGQAFVNFWSGRAKYPQYHKKGINDSFTVSNDQFSIHQNWIRIPKLGCVRMQETLRFAGKLLWAVFSRKADKWFVSISVELPENFHFAQTENQSCVGVDLGVKDLATLSDGKKISGPKPMRQQRNRLRRLSRSLSRKQKRSKNRQKAKIKLARLHAKIVNVRADSLHKLTSYLTRNFAVIGIEDLNVSGMEKNHHLARAISDMGFFEFRRELEYKAALRGVQVVIADQWFASSKNCSCCGHKLDSLALADREWTCPECGSHHDRDVNAAINLKNFAVSSTVIACGAQSSGIASRCNVKLSAKKQEADSKSDQIA